MLAARKIGDAMLAALPADGRLPGRFDADWKPTVKWSCLTGDCQLGINWGRLFQITGDARYRDATTRIPVSSSRPSCSAKEAGGDRRHQGFPPDQRRLPSVAVPQLGDQVLRLMMDTANRSGKPGGLHGGSVGKTPR